MTICEECEDDTTFRRVCVHCGKLVGSVLISNAGRDLGVDKPGNAPQIAVDRQAGGVS